MARRIVLRSDGLYISKPGKDALSGNDDDLLVSPSVRNTRARIAGVVTGYQVATIAHNLGYIPQFSIVSDDTDEQAIADIDENNIKITVNPGRHVKYVIFYDRWV